MFQPSPITVRKHLLSSMHEAERLMTLELFCGWVNQSINERAAVQAHIDAYKESDGRVWVTEAYRDCDGYSGSYTYRIEGTLLAFQQEYQRVMMGAEGPTSLRVVSGPVTH